MSRQNSFVSGSKMPGSNTPQDLRNMARFSGRPSLLSSVVEDGAGFLLAESLTGHMTGGVTGFVTMKLGRLFREAGLKRVDDLVEAAMLNPALARTLIAKVTPKNRAELLDRLGNQLKALLIEGPVNAETRARDQLDAVTRGVAALAPGTAVTARMLAQISGQSDIAGVRQRLVARGLIAEQSGRYVRAATVNSGAALAPPEVARPKDSIVTNSAPFGSVYKGMQRNAPTLRRQTLDDLRSEIESRTSPLYGTYRPGGLIEHVASIAGGTPMTHDVVHLLKRSGAIPRDDWGVLASKGDGWAKQFGVEAPSPGIRREEAVAQAFNHWLAGDLKLPPGLRRIFGSVREFAEMAAA